MGLSGFAVSPHTGARLETPIAMVQFTRMEDAPHTGARLETDLDAAIKQIQEGMPPTRGHDLKLQLIQLFVRAIQMPPTQGHMRMLCAKKFTV